MLKRPDWKDPEPYKKFLDPELRHFVAWEFLRRNPDYQKDSDAYQAESGDDLLDDDPERFRYWCRYCENRWKLIRPLKTDGDEFGGDEFIILRYERPERFKVVERGVQGPFVLVPVDLSMPLKDLERTVMWDVRRLRDDGVKSGVVKPRVNRVLAPRVYVEYLRILDAFAAGATVHEIGEVLSPGATNDPDSRQRDKRIKAAHGAAQKMQNDGYRTLLW